MLKFEAKKRDFAKIWQKLGGGGLQPPRLRRPCHVAWCRVKYRVRMISYLCISQFQAWPSPWAKPLDNMFDWQRIPHPWEKWVQTPSPPRAYKNELKPHPRGHFSQLFTIKHEKMRLKSCKLQDFIIFRWLKDKLSLQLRPRLH